MGWIIGALLLVAVPAVNVFGAEAKASELKTDDEKAIYALGILLSQNVTSFRLTPAELKVLISGIEDGASGKQSKVNVDEFRSKLQELAQVRAAAGAAEEKKNSAAFLEKMGKEKGAVKSDSGLIYIETQPGTGEQPQATDKVKVHYTGTLIDGTVFDSSVQRGQPATFPLNGVIKCWTEGVQKMKVGGKAKLICPSDIAYGDRGSPPRIKPGATLVFEVELLEILKDAGSQPASPH